MLITTEIIMITIMATIMILFIMVHKRLLLQVVVTPKIAMVMTITRLKPSQLGIAGYYTKASGRERLT